MDNDASNYRSRSDASRRLFGDRPDDEVNTRDADPILEADRRAHDSPFDRPERANADSPFSSRPLSADEGDRGFDRPARSRSSLFDYEPSANDDRNYGASDSSPFASVENTRSETSFERPRDNPSQGLDSSRERSSIFDRGTDDSSSVFSRRGQDEPERASGLRGGFDDDSQFAGAPRHAEEAPRLDRLGTDVPAPRRSFDSYDSEPPVHSRREAGSGLGQRRESDWDEPRRASFDDDSFGRQPRDVYEQPQTDRYDWQGEAQSPAYDDGYRGLHSRELESVDEQYAREFEYTDEAVDYRRAEPSGFEEFSQFDDQYENYQDNRRRRGPFLLLGSLIGVAAIAGGLIFVYKEGVREGQNDTVPVVEAPVDPSKVEPTEPSGLQVSDRTKLIYDRIIGEATVTDETLESREEPLLDPNDQALTNDGLNSQINAGDQNAGTQQSDTTGNEPLPLPLPPPPNGAIDNQQSGSLESDQGTLLASNDQSAALQPAIEPDQSGLQTQDSGVPATVIQPGDNADQAGLADQAAGENLPDQIAQLINSPPLPADKPVPPSRLADPGPAVPTGEVESNALPGSVPREDEQQVAGLDQSGPTPLNLQPSQQPVEQAQPPQDLSGNDTDNQGSTRFSDELGSGSNVQTDDQTSLGDQLASVLPETITPQQEPQSQVALSGNYVVQLASFSSVAEAEQEFARLRERHGSTLSGYQSFIEEADLGSRGIWHRLLIGPITERSTASQVCNSLISAGERDCFVRER